MRARDIGLVVLGVGASALAWGVWVEVPRLSRRLEALDDCTSRTDVWQTAEIATLKQQRRDADQAAAEHDAAHAGLTVKTADHLAAHAQHDARYAAQVGDLLERVAGLERGDESTIPARLERWPVGAIAPAASGAEQRIDPRGEYTPSRYVAREARVVHAAGESTWWVVRRDGRRFTFGSEQTAREQAAIWNEERN